MTRDDMMAFVGETLGPERVEGVNITPLGARGSDRTYFRVTWQADNSAVLVHYSPLRVENTYFVNIARFLTEAHLPVPRILGHDEDRCLSLMEDLGNSDLWSQRNAPWEARSPLYKKALTAIHQLHLLRERDVPSGRVRFMEGFGPELYRWERDYFKEHFIRDVCKIDLSEQEARVLEKELSHLAGRLMEGRGSFIHRDFQSQNIMIHKGGIFLIDFQGMRLGNPYYDLASLLCDPYVELTEGETEELLLFYRSLTGWEHNQSAFEHCFREASVQRLMQALGAYGFLGLTKGLTHFLGYIPAALENLDYAVSRIATLPRLKELIDTCRHSTSSAGTSPLP